METSLIKLIGVELAMLGASDRWRSTGSDVDGVVSELIVIRYYITIAPRVLAWWVGATSGGHDKLNYEQCQGMIRKDEE